MTPLAAALVEGIAKDRGEPLRLVGGERGGHECTRGWGKRIRCGVEEDVEIVACGWWGEGKLSLRLDMLKPRATCHGHEVAIIEAAEEVLVRRASGSVSVVEL
jgi:hypothetical protein